MWASYFHRSAIREAEDHYATLGLTPSATPSEIKKQFYKLSKAYHPDLHPDNEAAHRRFVRISEAHSVLGSPESKARYDREYFGRPAASSASTPKGSHSSAAGGRTPGGLSKRRGPFRGPPPSFYRNGGWNASSQSQSQSKQADMASSRHGSVEDDLSHFDRHGHYRTHETIEKKRSGRVRKREVEHQDDAFDFVTVSAVLCFAFGVAGAIWSWDSR
ncbi:DnaJ-domain-containing protein [Piedraia hortae CBS 480.64]|uniref:DnaJ-domain-containing protein n=1 Tax=Piedraia hortae CBS 480.64 TaxID=1314780 RepID=A0A6A7C9B0_9PEZI|nr:DnaJ-domain-containing protein [Piedraia hortae CBS 480.64]